MFPRSQGTVGAGPRALCARLNGACPRSPPWDSTYLSAADQSHRTDRSQGAENSSMARTTRRAAHGQSAMRRAVIMRSNRASAHSRFQHFVAAALTTESKSPSISRCSARPIIHGLRSILNGSTIGLTAASNMRKIRQRNIRISIRSISAPAIAGG